ncbi:MAG: pilus assembly protein PilV [Burkholderiaceae bacterium]
MNNARGNQRPGRKHAARGVMLIEALVALLIFAFGVLGLVGLQAAMTKAQGTAKFRADAAFLAQQVLGTMWSDAPNIANYAPPGGGLVGCTGYARCSSWASKVASTLPGGTAVVTVAGTDVTVVISWTQPNEGTHTYTTRSTIAFNTP